MDEQPKDQIVQMVRLRETDRAAHQLRDSGPKMRVFRFLLSRGRSQHLHTFAKPSPEEKSRVGLQQLLEHLDQGRLPSAVLTEHGMHLTRTHRTIDSIMCDQSPAPLDQAVRLAQRRLPTGWRHGRGRAVPFTPHRSASRLVVDERRHASAHSRPPSGSPRPSQAR